MSYISWYSCWLIKEITSGISLNMFRNENMLSDLYGNIVKREVGISHTFYGIIYGGVG